MTRCLRLWLHLIFYLFISHPTYIYLGLQSWVAFFCYFLFNLSILWQGKKCRIDIAVYTLFSICTMGQILRCLVQIYNVRYSLNATPKQSECIIIKIIIIVRVCMFFSHIVMPYYLLLTVKDSHICRSHLTGYSINIMLPVF